MFIADKENNCIRRIDIPSGLSSTYAGICNSTSSPLNSPESVAVDPFGNVLVYESVNKKIKIVYPNGCILNLTNGSCREAKNQVACYKSWVSEEEEQACMKSLEQKNCEKQSFLCDDESLLVGRNLKEDVWENVFVLVCW